MAEMRRTLYLMVAVGEVCTIDQIISVILLLDKIYALTLFISSHVFFRR